MDLLLHGLSNIVSSPLSLTVFFIALFGGLIFGAIPGVDEITLASISLPFTVFLSPTDAIMFFGVLYISGCTGGAVMAILFNIPGNPENAPTVLDGYQMTLKGQSSIAIGASIMCSAVGGIASSIFMILATEPIGNWAVRAFGPPEVFGLVFLGVCVSASVGADTFWKGWLSLLFGIVLATVGTEPNSGLPRFTFGTNYLMAGIEFIPLILGFFAVSEILVQGHKMATGVRIPPRVGIEFPKMLQLWRLKLAIGRSVLIGFFAGLLPGIGATLASFLSYSEAVRWSKHPERFGKGELEGVIAPETANNAATGAAMIPLLALGLPGGAMTAVMIGAFEMHGMEPGPMVLVTSKELVWTVFAAMLVANISIFLLGYIEAKTIVHLLRIPFRVLAPFILLITTIGAFALRNLFVDVWVMYIAGIVGYVMRRSGYSVSGIVLGVILGRIGESAFVKTVQIVNFDVLTFFSRPFAAAFVIGGLLALTFGIRRAIKLQRSPLVVADDA